jgi:hypothetical protein
MPGLSMTAPRRRRSARLPAATKRSRRQGLSTAQHESGIGAELPGAHRQRLDERRPIASARASSAAGISTTGFTLDISA